MTLWGRTRTEVAGAWRSLRYDLGRRNTPPAGDHHAEVTSTGLSTFGGAGVHRRPRRPAAVAALGVLAVAGATGSYFAVVNGIGTLAGDNDEGVEPYPLAAAAPGNTPRRELSNEGFGAGTKTVRKAPARSTIRVIPTTAVPATTPPRPVVTPAQPPRTTVAPTSEPADPGECCLAPPVPTPTFVPSTPQDPSPTPSASEPGTQPGTQPAPPAPTAEPSGAPLNPPSATKQSSHSHAD